MLSYGIQTQDINEFKLLNSELHRKVFPNQTDDSVTASAEIHLKIASTKGRDEKGTTSL